MQTRGPLNGVDNTICAVVLAVVLLVYESLANPQVGWRAEKP